MQRFFIDLHDGAHFVADTKGIDLADEHEALAKLTRIMPRLAEDFPASVGRQDYLAIVRDSGRRVILRAHLSLDVERL